MDPEALFSAQSSIRYSDLLSNHWRKARFQQSQCWYINEDKIIVSFDKWLNRWTKAASLWSYSLLLIHRIIIVHLRMTNNRLFQSCNYGNSTYKNRMSLILRTWTCRLLCENSFETLKISFLFRLFDINCYQWQYGNKDSKIPFFIVNLMRNPSLNKWI